MVVHANFRCSYEEQITGTPADRTCQPQPSIYKPHNYHPTIVATPPYSWKFPRDPILAEGQYSQMDVPERLHPHYPLGSTSYRGSAWVRSG